MLVVAPWSQQSGAGARMTTPGFAPVPLTVQAVNVPATYGADCCQRPEPRCRVRCVHDGRSVLLLVPSASPADAVNIALARFAKTYWPTGPDVVLSGVNFGQNVGSTLAHSGTVGAAVTAHEYGVPAIAFSAEVPRNLAADPVRPVRPDRRVRGHAARASWSAQPLAGSPTSLLNVNHPYVGTGETARMVSSAPSPARRTTSG